MKLIQCPSGLSGHVRGLKGKEAAIFTDKVAMKSGQFLDRILKACWEETLEPGPYQMGKDGKPTWSEVLSGDRLFLFLRVRAETLGEIYEAQIKCPECGKRIQKEVNLLELELKTLSPEDMEGFVNGNVLTGELPDGKEFTFRLATGQDELRAAKLGEDASMSQILATRITGVEGESSVRAYLDEAPLPYLFAVLAEMQRRDCGVDTGIQFECKCGEAGKIDLPFGRGFLVPEQRTA